MGRKRRWSVVGYTLLLISHAAVSGASEPAKPAVGSSEHAGTAIAEQRPAAAPVELRARLSATPMAEQYTRAAIAADDARAAEAGMQVLAKGGTAADAAAAVMLVLGVVSPGGSGLGGGGMALYYQARDRSLTFLDFRERAPQAAKPELFTAEAVKTRRGLVVGVPGEPAGIEMLVKRFGKLPLAEVAQPAIQTALHGFDASEHLARMTQMVAANTNGQGPWTAWTGGSTVSPGQKVRRSMLADAIRLYGDTGSKVFYRGMISKWIAEAVKKQGGVMTREDLAEYRVLERTPLTRTVFGQTWATAPPPSAGGYTLLASLALLERTQPKFGATTNEVALLHRFTEAWKGPFLDRQRYFGDPDYVPVPLAELLEGLRVQSRGLVFNAERAQPAARYDLPLPNRAQQHAKAPNNHGTSHLCVVDAAGNVASVTTSVNTGFGARFAASDIVLNNQLEDFTFRAGATDVWGLEASEANLIGPGRRPVSTMSPTIVFRDGEPVLCIGGSGGSQIVTAVSQVAYRTTVLKQPPAAAMGAPRIHHQGMPDVVSYDQLSKEALEGLRKLGHKVEQKTLWGAVNMIAIENVGGKRQLTAVVDALKGGRPAGQ